MTKEKTHDLNSNWVLWVHKVDDHDWERTSYIEIFKFKTIEDYWYIYNNWEDLMPPLDNGIFFLMREGVFP